MAKKKQTELEKACADKLDELAAEIAKTKVDDEKMEILSKNAEYLKKIQKQDPKGFKNWISKIEASDVIKLAFSVAMFVTVLYAEEIGHMLTSRASQFIPWKN